MAPRSFATTSRHYNEIPSRPNFDATLVRAPQIFVRDPPREHLPAESGPFSDSSACLSTRFPGHLDITPATELYITYPEQPKSLMNDKVFDPTYPSHQRGKMAKKRRSLQSIFIPSLRPAQTSPTTTDFESTTSQGVLNPSSQSVTSDASHISSKNSPPPDFLLDDDPFANLNTVSAAHSTPTPTASPLPVLPPIPTSPLEAIPSNPRSPLTPPNGKTSFVSPQSSASRLSRPGVSRALSGRARPAYQKPAFAPRPSLPSLDTLARMNIVLTKKIRKGRVGATLPFEPWDQLDNGRSSEESSDCQSQESLLLGSPVNGLAGLSDFVSELELGILDVPENDAALLEEHSSPVFASVLHTSPISHDDHLYNADSELSLDEDSILSSSRTSSEEVMSRTSLSMSESSFGSTGENRWPSFSRYNASTSSVDDSDALHSPPDDFVNLPKFGFDASDIFSSYWSTEDLYESLGGPTLHATSGVDSTVDIEPGTSTGTIRPSKVMPSSLVSGGPEESEAIDGAERDYQYQRSRGQWERGSNGGNDQLHGTNAGFSGWVTSSKANGLRGRGDDEDEDDKRDRINRSTFSTPSDSEASTSDDADEDSTDDYGQPHVPTRDPEGLSASSDDDVPLAQRIPTALQAQSTIRRKAREEREQRRIARAAKAAASVSPRTQPAVLPLGASNAPAQPAVMSSSQEAALHASKSVRRPRTRTVPASEMQPFSPDHLARNLKTVEIIDTSASTHHRSKSTSSRRDRGEKPISRPGSAGHGSRDATTFQPFTSPIQSPVTSDFRPLRPMRSFHRPARRVDDQHAVPLPADAGQKLARSLTRKEEASELSPRSPPNRVLQDEIPPLRQPLGRKPGEEPRKLTKVHPETRSARSSSEVERQPRPSLQQLPPVPPLPLTESLPTASTTARGTVTQQRIFIGDMQRFNIVEISSATNARDVIEMVEAQGSLKGWVGTGDWMLWEVAQDFGMERPVRSFELLSDVQASWNKDKLMNTFIIKLTPLAPLLSRSAIPSASPTYAGYVQWESKRGKWSKRWLQLREHSLWLSKRDNGRDEVLLCSLSNFDAYFITRLHKAPHRYSFAVKSTDSLSFFENTADYLHIFSCSEKEGNTWMECILLARSYVLHQERHILFSPKASAGNAAGGAGSLSRSGTRHQPPTRPIQPLLSVTAPMAITQQKRPEDIFEPGSLLRKHA